MDSATEESYIIKKAKVDLAGDPFAAKAWILTAKTLYPKNFAIQVSLSYQLSQRTM